MTSPGDRLTPAVEVVHALGRYPVYVQPGALSALPALVETHLGGRTVALVTDACVGRHFEEWESGAGGRWHDEPGTAAAGVRFDVATRLSILPGEESKTRESWIELSDALFSQGFGRDAGIVALGGGVVGDLAGFVAATYMRGIPYIQVPTTLLAMVDASVGGKTGVDTPHGKNLVGAFHPPVAVVADPVTLRSLPDREYRSGLAEAVKHGLIADAAYFEWVESSVAPILARDLATLTVLIRRSVEIKAEVVAADERESGRRAILNAGHTVAHALEGATDYAIAHGEAVALGLVAECAMAERLGVAGPGVGARVGALLGRLGLPVRLQVDAPLDRVRGLMTMDKKNRDGRVHCALPSAVGAMARAGADWTFPVELPIVHKGLAAIA